MQLKYYNPRSLKPLLKYIKPDKFIEDMAEKDLIKPSQINDAYSSKVYNLCRNATAWIIQQIMDKGDELIIYQMDIMVGRFAGASHTWIQAGDYYIDLTLAQFVPDAPKIAITKSAESTAWGLYIADEVMEVSEWVKYEMKESSADFEITKMIQDFESQLDKEVEKIKSIAINGKEIRV